MFSHCTVTEPYWLMMSSAEFLIVQLFCVAGFYITRRLNEISTLDSVRRAQKRDLWLYVHYNIPNILSIYVSIGNIYPNVSYTTVTSL